MIVFGGVHVPEDATIIGEFGFVESGGAFFPAEAGGEWDASLIGDGDKEESYIVPIFGGKFEKIVFAIFMPYAEADDFDLNGTCFIDCF